jgi:2-keto-3-deoxy-L-rhamnonate aldolase RhmA
VPYVETVAEVRQIVGAVHLRPIKGRQLQDLLDGKLKPKEVTRAFLDRFNRHNYVIIGIESVAGYENLDALIGVDGVDGVFMGPHDLSVSLEIPEQWDHPALLGLMEDTIRRCRAAGKGVGVHVSHLFSEAQTHRFISLGMNWILDSADISHTLQSLQNRRRALCGTPLSPPESKSDGPSLCIAPAASARNARAT